MKLLPLIFLYLLFASPISHGALYQCITPDGATEFQDVPCELHSKESTLSTDYNERGFLKKWFKIPLVSGQVKCDAKVCSCGDEKVNISWWRAENAVPKMVDGLLSAWQTYKTLPKNATRDIRKTAGCGIRTYQEAFNISYQKFTKESLQTKNGLNKARDSKETCQKDRDDKLERRIQESMSPPYNQSRRLAEINSAYPSHMGNPCIRLYNSNVSKLPQNVGSLTKGEVHASLERLK
jgi:hypothetical protein